MAFMALILLGGWINSDVTFYLQQAENFLKKMPAGLQEHQREAIEEAMAGEPALLRVVREGRNAKPTFSPRIKVTDVTPSLRLYQPKSAKTEKLPLLVYLHGGGWTIGSMNSCARYCSELAATGKVMVLAVDYRLAPENPYPCGLNDCVTAVEYAYAHAQEWGSSAQLVSVGGDSSGGNLALATALRLQHEKKQAPHSLVLYYPVVAAWNDGTSSWKDNAKGKALDGALMNAFNKAYLEGVNHSNVADARKNPFISPVVASDEALKQLPRTLMVCAERDILLDQGEAFAKRLKEVDSDVQRKVLPGSVHLFVTVPGQEKAFKEAVRCAECFLTGKKI